jgi:hypothetical protein
MEVFLFYDEPRIFYEIKDFIFTFFVKFLEFLQRSCIGLPFSSYFVETEVMFGDFLQCPVSLDIVLIKISYRSFGLKFFINIFYGLVT